MKPAWDQLAAEFKDSKTSGVFDVDCTADGKDLCEQAGVKGYPTIKYGSGDEIGNLKDYDGGRDFEALKTFADENLGPVCGPKTVEACSDEEKKQIAEFSAKPLAELDVLVKKLSKDFDTREKKYNKKKRKFDERDKENQEYSLEHMKEKRKNDAARLKLEKNEKASKAEKVKQSERDKKLEARGDKLDKEMEALGEERKEIKAIRQALDAEIVGTGIKLMKAVQIAKQRNEL